MASLFDTVANVGEAQFRWYGHDVEFDVISQGLCVGDQVEFAGMGEHGLGGKGLSVRQVLLSQVRGGSGRLVGMTDLIARPTAGAGQGRCDYRPGCSMTLPSESASL